MPTHRDPPTRQDLVRWSERINTGTAGAVRIGMIDASAVIHHPEVLRAFRRARPGVDLLVPVLHEAIDLRHLWQAGGAGAVLGHAAGRHDPTPAALRRAERPALRAVS